MGCAATVSAVPSHIADGVAARIDVWHVTPCATGGILPLGLGGQAEVDVKVIAQACDELLSFVPRDVIDRQFHIACINTGIIAHDGLPQLLGDLGHSQTVGGQQHAMSGSLVVGRKYRLFVGRAHVKRAAPHIFYPECDRVIDKRFFLGSHDDGDRRVVTRDIVLDIDARCTHSQSRNGHVIGVH